VRGPRDLCNRIATAVRHALEIEAHALDLGGPGWIARHFTRSDIGSGAQGTLDALIDMPCPGSSGAGETMGMQIVFVVTE
jgi:hypothetical protein